MDRVLALHARSRRFNSHRGHMSERFFRSNRPGYPHPVSSELENSGIRVAVGDCSVTERRLWRPPYQTGKTVHMHAKTLQTQRGRTHCAGCVQQWFRTAEPLGERRYENWNTHTQSYNLMKSKDKRWMDTWHPKLGPWIRSAEVLGGWGGERCYENRNTTTIF